MIERASSAADIWQTAQGELQLQLPRETFDTWLRNARLIAYEDGTYIIGVHNVYAREWLEHRLKKVIVRTVGRIARRTVEVRFVVAAESGHRARKRREHEAEEALRAGPLLAELQPPHQEPPRFERLTPGETGLNPRQTFDTFAVGPCNQLAHVAASAIVESDAMPFNPLYVHAGVGLGKTHLLHAIGNAAAACGRRTLYVTSETFTNDLVGAIRSRSTGDFRSKYREVDVLLVDDVQFLAGKESSQEEFYHTFNALLNANAQVVVAASAPPAEIPGLDPRLSSRFEGGLVLELQPPDAATRFDILNLKLHARALAGRLPTRLLEQIALEVQGSVRDLEGALNRVVAATLVANEAPTLDETQAILEKLQPARSAAELPVEDILMAVADAFDVTLDALCGRDRSREVSSARQVAMYIAHKKAEIPLQQVGEALGGRNHSTVLYSCERVEALLATDSRVRRQVAAVLRTLLPQSVGQA